MTLRHLGIFVAVYQNQSITKAAVQLHLAQPSVSLAIRELEQYYGIRLFDRMARRIYPTETGNRFYEYALHIVSLFDEMEKSVRDWEDSDRLRIGASVTVGSFLLSFLIKEYKKLHPDIRISVVVKNAEAIEQYALDNQVDFGLIAGTVTNPKLCREAFFSDRMCLIAAPGHPLSRLGSVTLQMLGGCDLLLRESGSAVREITDSLFHSHGLSITPAWESVSTEALIRAAADGLGVSILPYTLVKEDLLQKKIVELPLCVPELSRPFYLVHHQNKFLSPAAKDFFSLCKDSAVHERLLSS